MFPCALLRAEAGALAKRKLAISGMLAREAHCSDKKQAVFTPVMTPCLARAFKMRDGSWTAVRV
jgi:hypothetical protein